MATLRAVEAWIKRFLRRLPFLKARAQRAMRPNGDQPNRRVLRQLTDRWIRFAEDWRSDNVVTTFEDVAKRAAQKFYNGIVLDAGLHYHAAVSDDVRKRIAEINKIANSYKLNLIPEVFGAGGAWSIIYYAPDLVHYGEGAAVKGALFEVVEPGDKAVHIPQVDVRYEFDHVYDYNGIKLFNVPNSTAVTSISGTKPGTMSLPDFEVGKTAPPSLRIESGSAPAVLRVYCNLLPRRQYRFSVWVKTEGLDCTSFRLDAKEWQDPYKWRVFCHEEVKIEPTGDWQKIEFGFNSMDMSSILITAGVYGARAGKIWFDDIELKEVGLVNVLRRPGTPVTIWDADDGKLYVEGIDYEYITDPAITKSYRCNHDGPPIKILSGGRIARKFNETGMVRLNVNFYHGFKTDRTCPCLSEPRVYSTWEEQYKIVSSTIPHSAVLLSIDEVRIACTCAACKARNMSAAQIMGDCASRMAKIVRKTNRKARLFTWCDMYNPHQNAVERYWAVEGSLVGSWDYVPKDIGMIVWGGDPYPRGADSLRFFAAQRFRTMVAGYYDPPTPEVMEKWTRGWAELAMTTPNCRGMMYTTWTHNYEDIEKFADIMLGLDGSSS